MPSMITSYCPSLCIFSVEVRDMITNRCRRCQSGSGICAVNILVQATEISDCEFDESEDVHLIQ